MVESCETRIGTSQVEIRALDESVHADGQRWWRVEIVGEEEVRTTKELTPREREARRLKEAREEAGVGEPVAAVSEGAAMEEVRVRLRASWAERCTG